MRKRSRPSCHGLDLTMITRRTRSQGARRSQNKVDAPERPEHSLQLYAYELLRAVSLFPGEEPLLVLQRVAKLGRGRRGAYDARGILEMVEARCNVAATQGRRLRRGAALAELLFEQLKRRDPRKYQRVQQLRTSFEHEHSASGALRKALLRVIGTHFHTLERELSYSKNGRPKTPRRRV